MITGFNLDFEDRALELVKVFSEWGCRAYYEYSTKRKELRVNCVLGDVQYKFTITPFNINTITRDIKDLEIHLKGD